MAHRKRRDSEWVRVLKQQGLQVFLTGAMGRWVFKDETNDGSGGKTNLVKVGNLSSLSLLLSTRII
jgi:hypothetical protein